MFFDILFFVFVFLILFGEFLYPKIIRLLPKNVVKKTELIPDLTVLIPARNEQAVIADKIKNTLALDYPKDKLKIVVIDSGSGDNTYKIAKKFPITLLKSESGKIRALNKGLACAKTEVVAVTDADVMLDRRSLRNAVSFLAEGVGAVNGYVVASAKKRNSQIKEKIEYKRKDWELRYQESLVDSACNLDGKFFVFKKSIFRKFSERDLVDDYPMSLAIRKKGQRLLVDKGAKIFENLEENLKEEFEQFRRYALSVLVINFRNIKFLFNPRYGYYGLLIFPFRRFFPVLYPLFLFYIAIFLTVKGSILVLPMLLLAGLVLFFVKKLTAIQILAILSSYVSLFNKNNLKSGEWVSSLRKK